MVDPQTTEPSRKPYIGRHKGPNLQKDRRSLDGRDRTKAEVADTYDPANTEDGRAKEQQHLNREGGVDGTDNKRNEVRKEKWEEKGIDPPPPPPPQQQQESPTGD